MEQAEVVEGYDRAPVTIAAGAMHDDGDAMLPGLAIVAGGPVYFAIARPIFIPTHPGV